MVKMANNNILPDALFVLLLVDLFFNYRTTFVRLVKIFIMIMLTILLEDNLFAYCCFNLKNFLTIEAFLMLTNIYFWANEPILYLFYSFINTFFGINNYRYSDPNFIKKIVTMFTALYVYDKIFSPYVKSFLQLLI